MTEFWHDNIIDKSFYTLQSLRKEYDFVLIGGWAVFLYTKALKSKDIDIVVEPETLGRLKTRFDVIKNERLKKYEIKADSFDIDIYTPFWSELGLPLDFVIKNAISISGFNVPKKEILLILKLFTYTQRAGSLKGRKDMLDIVGLLYRNEVDFRNFRMILKQHNLEWLQDKLIEMLNTAVEIEELSLNRKQFADFKKSVLKNLNEK